MTNSTGIEPTELHVDKATKMVPTLATTAGKPLLFLQPTNLWGTRLQLPADPCSIHKSHQLKPVLNWEAEGLGYWLRVAKWPDGGMW